MPLIRVLLELFGTAQSTVLDFFGLKETHRRCAWHSPFGGEQLIHQFCLIELKTTIIVSRLFADSHPLFLNKRSLLCRKNVQGPISLWISVFLRYITAICVEAPIFLGKR